MSLQLVGSFAQCSAAADLCVSAVLCVMWPRVLLYLFRGRVAYLTLAT